MNRSHANNTPDVLLVEDNLGDVGLVRETFKDLNLPNPIHVLHDGVQALEYLHQEGKFSDQPRPGVIILDLNIPKKDGREVLAEIKADPELKLIPVIILTSSKAREDIEKSYALHANCYVTKPVVLEDFMRLVSVVAEFWLNVVRLPS
ncbi:MAG TPA: response regulator [Terriglobia bacterium]|jgi:two-component system response regulator